MELPSDITPDLSRLQIRLEGYHDMARRPGVDASIEHSSTICPVV